MTTDSPQSSTNVDNHARFKSCSVDELASAAEACENPYLRIALKIQLAIITIADGEAAKIAENGKTTLNAGDVICAVAQGVAHGAHSVCSNSTENFNELLIALRLYMNEQHATISQVLIATTPAKEGETIQ